MKILKKLKHKKAFVALVIVVIGLFNGLAVGQVNAQLTITQTKITEVADPQVNFYPSRIYGNLIVWSDNRTGDYDVYMYDLSSGTETSVTENHPGNQIYPTIYGDIIVWYESLEDFTKKNITMYDLSTKTETQITNQNSIPGWPVEIYDDIIVWNGYTEMQNNIYMYNLTSKTETQITTKESGNTYSPVIYGDVIAYVNWTNNVQDIYMCNLVSKTVTQITDDYTSQSNPAIYGNRIVWTDNRNGKQDIYMYDLSTGEETQITTDLDRQVYPAIYGDLIVWHDFRNDFNDIYMYDLSTGVETRITSEPAQQQVPAIYGNHIVWQDTSYTNIGTIQNLYMAELSFGSTPSDAVEAVEDIQTNLNDPTLIPETDLKDNKRNALLNRLNAVIMDIQTASNSADATTQLTAYQSALEQLNSILEKTDGCAERGTPDDKGSGYAPDWITTCESQAQIDPVIRDLIATLETLITQI